MADDKKKIGARIELDGEKEYRAAIKDINKDMQVLRSELSKVSEKFRDNSDSMDAINARSEVLNKQILKQKETLEILKRALENAAAEYGENDHRTKEWSIKINNAERNLIKMERELRDNTAAMDDAGKTTEDTAEAVEDLGKEVESATKKTSVFGDVLKANLLSDAIQKGVQLIGRAIKDTVGEGIELASDLIESQNVIDVTFGASAASVDSWAQNLTASFGMSELSAKTFSGTMGAMLKSMQVADGEVLTMSKNLTELAGDMASFYNVSLEDMFTKLRSGISGQTEPLKQLGVNLNVANLEAFALEEGITKAYSAMSQAEQVTLRYNYLMKVTADAQGDFARNAGTHANQQKILSLELENFKTRIGENVLPSLTESFGKLNELLDDSGDKIGDLISGGVELLIGGFSWIIDNAGLVAGGISGVIAAMSINKVITGITAMTASMIALKTATDAQTQAQAAQNIVAKANPYIMGASIIAGLVAAVGGGIMASKMMTEETEKLAEEFDKTTKSIETNYRTHARLTEELYSLNEATEKTAEEKAKMKSLVDELNKAYPDLNLNINEETGELNKQKEAVDKLLESKRRLAEFEAREGYYYKLIEELEEKRIELEILLADYEPMEPKNQPGGQAAWDFFEDWDRAKTAGDIEELEEAIAEIEHQIKIVEELMGRDAPFKEASDNYDKWLSEIRAKYDTHLSLLKSESEESWEKHASWMKKEQENYLADRDKQLREHQEGQIEAAQKAAEEEQAILDKSHNRKLENLNAEYLATLKIYDEDKYNALKAIEDEINGINAAKTADDKALKEREQAEKLSELRRGVEFALTTAERIKAREALAEYESQIAQEKLAEERAARIETLEADKKLIEDSYKEKVKALDDETKLSKDNLNEEYEAEKKANEERETMKLERLKEAHKDYLVIWNEDKDRRMAAYQEDLDEQLARWEANEEKKLAAATANAKKRMDAEIELLTNPLYDPFRGGYSPADINAAMSYAKTGVNSANSQIAAKYSQGYAGNNMASDITNGVASALAMHGGGNITIVPTAVNIDGREIAQIIFTPMQNEAARRGVR